LNALVDEPILELVSIRRFFAILVALAVLAAPGVTSAALAAAPHHDMAMMEGGHCQTPPSQSDHHDKTAGKSCCIAMCMAVAITPATPLLEEHAQAAQNNFFVPTAHDGYLREIATPPPRSA